jgi:hypothetical protein
MGCGWVLAWLMAGCEIIMGVGFIAMDSGSGWVSAWLMACVKLLWGNKYG